MTSPALIAPNPMTFGDYLVWEARQDRRHEFVDGFPRMMAGAGRNHVSITPELARVVGNALAGKTCRYFDADTKLRVGENAFYPDGMIACPPNFISENAGVIDNPTVIFEVLSPGTQKRDLGAKFEAYARVPTLKEYVVIFSDAPLIHVYARQSEGWGVTIAVGETTITHIPSLGIELPHAELYARVEFEVDPEVD